MASVNWEKYKTTIEVKAHIRHNEKQCREQTKEHNNQHIDKTKSCYNYSLLHRSYAERCKMYDDIIADIQARNKKALRKDAVTCLSLETAVPEQLPEDKIQAWFLSYHKILCNFFGIENIIDTDVHCDEQHEYIDPETHKKTMSRVHSHTLIVPRTSDKRLCCKEISSRKNIIELNRQIEEMSQREYGVQFNNGKTARKKSVEQLKAESLKLEISANQETLKKQAEIMQKAPKKRIFKKFDYHMSEQEHNEWLDFGETIKHSVNNALASEEKEKEISKQLDEVRKLKEQQERLIAERAEQRARQLANNALLIAKRKEQDAEKAKQEAEQEKQKALYEKNKYINLKKNEETYIVHEAIKRADKVSSTFRSLDMRKKFAMLGQSRIDTVQAPQKAYDDEYYK
mgnify:CR=1 FL=1